MGRYQEEHPDYYRESDYECPECDKKDIQIEQAAVHLKAILAMIYGHEALDKDELGRELEELACQLDMDKHFSKHCTGEMTITREHPMSYFDDAVNMTRQYANQFLQEII